MGSVMLVRYGSFGIGQVCVVWCWSDMGSVMLVRYGSFGIGQVW